MFFKRGATWGSVNHAKSPRDQVGFIGPMDGMHISVMIDGFSRRIKLEDYDFAYGEFVIKGLEGWLRSRENI